MVLLGAQRSWQTIVIIAGIGVGRGQSQAKGRHEQQKPLHDQICGKKHGKTFVSGAFKQSKPKQLTKSLWQIITENNALI